MKLCLAHNQPGYTKASQIISSQHVIVLCLTPEILTLSTLEFFCLFVCLLKDPSFSEINSKSLNTDLWLLWNECKKLWRPLHPLSFLFFDVDSAFHRSKMQFYWVVMATVEHTLLPLLRDIILYYLNSSIHNHRKRSNCKTSEMCNEWLYIAYNRQWCCV